MLNDKAGKFAIRVVIYSVLFILIAFSIVVIKRITSDKYVKIWGIEFNSIKIDTVKSRIPSNHDSSSNPEISQKQVKRNTIDKKILNIPTSALIKQQKQNNQQIIKGKNISTGSNSGNVGDNGHVVNGVNFGINGDQYVGIKQRHFDQITFNDLLTRLAKIDVTPNNLSKNKISIVTVSGDDEMKIYAYEIKKKLEENTFRVTIGYGTGVFMMVIFLFMMVRMM